MDLFVSSLGCNKKIIFTRTLDSTESDAVVGVFFVIMIIYFYVVYLLDAQYYFHQSRFFIMRPDSMFCQLLLLAIARLVLLIAYFRFKTEFAFFVICGNVAIYFNYCFNKSIAQGK